MTHEEYAAAPAIRDRIIDFRRVPASELVPHPLNPRKHSALQRSALRETLDTIGLVGVELVRELEDGRLQLLDGHMRAEEVVALGDQAIPVVVTDLSAEEALVMLASFDPIGRLATFEQDRATALAAQLDSRHREVRALLRAVSAHDSAHDLLARLEAERFQLGLAPEGDYGTNGANGHNGSAEDDEPDSETERRENALAERFGAPPFSVLDTRQGYWQQRKRAWLSLGIESELGRDVAGANIRFGANSAMQRVMRGAEKDFAAGNGNEAPALSIFDPVLCELVYRWFSPEDGVVLDPFAGGSVRGIVAAKSDRHYVGIDLREEQVFSNREQAARILDADGYSSQWIAGDSRDLATHITHVLPPVDCVFTCPPYANLERYSDDPRDLSTLDDYQDFREAYSDILEQAINRLQDDRFAAIVVGDVRDEATGFLLPLVQDTIAACEHAGAHLYNAAVVITPAGTLPLRSARTFGISRKLGRCHQHLLVFVKGDVRRAVAACGEVTLPDYGELVSAAGEDWTRDETTATPAPVAQSVHTLRPATEAKPLVRWMERLYRLSAREQDLVGDLGLWPEELGDYLTGLCLAYSPGVARFTLAPGLLLADTDAGDGDEHEKPKRDKTALLLLSGGKDSLATGILAEQQLGYQVRAVYVQRINRSYPHEHEHAAAIASAMGWPFEVITPQRLPRAAGESLVKNQYALSLALDAVGFRPGLVLGGFYQLDDCHTTAWYSDMVAANTAFAAALTIAHPGVELQMLLVDERHATTVWLDAPEEARRHTASCLTPARYKPQHRTRLLKSGVPLLDYDCGVCEKCYTRAVLLDQLAPDRFTYPAEYLKRAEKMLAKAFSTPLWCHAHPQLVTPLTEDSASYLLRETFAGALRCTPRRNENASIEPIVTRLSS